ncbi:glycosyltransferase family 2 protein [Candidatus Saccharibacteria bacterium]|nr:glycosyltransferase family 2 protein [Candidatus Saccharibacteria bacterium]
MKLSIVVPAYNEAASIEKFHRSLVDVLKSIGSHEIIYVDDGSRDGTLDKLYQLTTSETVKIVSLSRNFGKEAALTAGLAQAKGDAIIMLDSDGQHPVELIPEFIAAWQAGSQVVIGVRKQNKHHSVIARAGSWLFNVLLHLISSSKVVPGATDFRLIDSSVKDEFLKLTEKRRITRGLIDWLGFDTKYIYFNQKNRIAGKPSYNFRKLTGLAIHSFVASGPTPLYLFGWVGGFITIISGIVGLFVIIEALILRDPMHLDITGSGALGLLVLFLVGIVLVSQAVTALYISSIHTEALNRPLYVIDKKKSKNL